MHDLINRQDVIDVIEKRLVDRPKNDCEFYENSISEFFLCMIEDLPSAQKKGKWMHDRDDELYAGYCSCCEWKANIMETDVAGMPYCPNCGARME